MNKREISWYIDSKSRRLAGIEDTGNGWAVVNSEGERYVEITEYTKESRATTVDFFNWYIEKIKKEKDE